MIRSMTGFSRRNATIAESSNVTLTIRTVNHRFLEVSARLPESLWEFEPLVRSVAAEYLSRGKIDVSVRIQKGSLPDAEVHFNREVAEKLLREVRDAAAALAIEDLPSIRDIILVPGIVETEPTGFDPDDAFRSEFIEMLRGGFLAVNEMRGSEGTALHEEITARAATIGRLREELERRRTDIVRESLDRYRERVAEIAQAAGVEIDQDRLAQETVLMVEKGDIVEELTRLDVHLAQLREVLSGDEPAGKKLDFLSQEMLREINTIGSKSRASDIRSLVIELKAEVERIREQVQNVE